MTAATLRSTIVLSLAAAGLLAACAPIAVPPSPPEGQSSSSSAAEVAIDPAVKILAENVLASFTSRNTQPLHGFIHPTKGVRFTPYTNVSPKSDVVFRPETLPTTTDTKILEWGFHDGSGLPIQMTFAQYIDQFIADKDFTTAPVVRWNMRMEYGSAIDNAREVYPDSQIVEYYFPGFEKQYEGLDWEALRLVFEKFGERWYLVGVIHDRWSP